MIIVESVALSTMVMNSFVVPTLYGLIHHTYPGLSRSRLAWPQCVAHFVGVLVFIPGLVIAIQTGNPAGAIAGATIVMLATLTFGYIFLSVAKSD